MTPQPPSPDPPGGPAGCAASTSPGHARAGAGRPPSGDLDARSAALMELMADPSARVWNAVRRQLEPLAGALAPHLRARTASPDPRVRARARALLQRYAEAGTLRRLARLCGPRQIDLESGFWRLSALAEPGFDARPHRARLDDFAARVRSEAAQLRAGPAPPKHPDQALALALIEVLGREAKLAGSSQEYDHPDRIYLHRVLETGRGMPLTLTAIYLAVARRVGLGARAIALPGHVLLQLDAGERRLLVDPFHGGAIRTMKDIQAQLREQGLRARGEWFRPPSDASLFARALVNLSRSLSLRGRSATARRLADLARCIGLRERARKA